MAPCRALAEVLLVVIVDEEARVDVLGRGCSTAGSTPTPTRTGPGGIEDLLAAEDRPHPPRRGFGVIGLRNHLRVVATGCDSSYGHRVSLL
jgi:hypothetical protein